MVQKNRCLQEQSMVNFKKQKKTVENKLAKTQSAIWQAKEMELHRQLKLKEMAKEMTIALNQKSWLRELDRKRVEVLMLLDFIC